PGTFDLVITRSVLVLLDRQSVLPNLVRQLAPQGTGLFIENMNEHPALRLWRTLTRTKWGTQPYLSVPEIQTFNSYFGEIQTHFVGLFLPLAGALGCFEHHAV